MRARFSSSALRWDKTFAVALGCVALFGAAELIALVFYYATHGSISFRRSAVTAVHRMSERSLASSATMETVANPPSATPAETMAPVSMVDRLLRQATKLRERGDTANALARLQEALQHDAKNVNILAEMAMLYESIQLFDRSNETWRRVQELGPSVGPLYELADMKLKIGVPPAPTAQASSAASPFGPDGIPEGSTFGITEVTPTQANDPDAEIHMTLRVAVKKRENTPIDYTKVKIQVFFYDILNNERVVLTDADVNYEWLTPHHNWTDANPEVLAVTYLRPKKDALSSDAALTAAAAAVTPPPPGKKSRSTSEPPPPAESGAEPGQRKYLGYIVRVYYKDQLQAVRADPNRLLNLFPPPFTAPTQ